MKRRMTSLMMFSLFLGVVSVASAARKRPPIEYYQPVHQRNVFRPLGWSPPDNRPQYTLVLTALSAEAEVDAPEDDFWGAIMGRSKPKEPAGPPRPDRALIQQNGGSLFYVAVGDKVNNLTVEKIEQGRVSLKGEKPEETVSIGLQDFSFAGGGGGGGGGPMRGGPPSGFTPPMGGGPPGGFQMPPGGMEGFRERFQNMSPEEREQMRMRFQQGGGGGRGGGGGGRGGGGRGRG